MYSRLLVGLAFCVGWGAVVAPLTAEATSPVSPYVVCFDTGSRVIKPSGAEQIEKAVAHVTRGGPRTRLSVDGRTDAAEARSHSIDLSADRAIAVKDRLVVLGVPPEYIQVRALADSAPWVPSTGDEPQNRCALI